MQPLTIEMTLEKSTKNKHVYAAPGTAVPSVYVEKTELPDPAPKTLKLTISAG